MELTKDDIDKMYPNKYEDEMTVGDLIISLSQFPHDMIVRTIYKCNDVGETLMTEKIRSVEMVYMIKKESQKCYGDALVVGDEIINSKYIEHVNIENAKELVIISEYKALYKSDINALR